MREKAEKEGVMAQPRQTFTSDFRLTNGILKTPSLLFYLELGLVCKKNVDSSNTIPESASTVSYSLPWMHDNKEIKTEFQVLLPKQWSF